MRSRKFHQRIVSGLLVGLVCVLLPLELHAQEPRYQGRTFAEWKGDLQDLSPGVRREAVWALGNFGPRAVPVLISALRDTDPVVRRWAANVLFKIGPAAKDAVPALAQALKKDTNWWVQVEASEALKKIEGR